MRDTGSMIQGNGMEAEREVGILGQILVTPRWVNDLVWYLEILRRRRVMTRWADDLVWWLRMGLY